MPEAGTPLAALLACCRGGDFGRFFHAKKHRPQFDPGTKATQARCPLSAGKVRAKVLARVGLRDGELCSEWAFFQSNFL
jgi:hypothetical protein